MRDGEKATPFVQIRIDDSPESRLFVELSSYGSDLAEARHALDLAVRGFEPESALAAASRYLVDLASVAYCRAHLDSKVRGRLTDHVAVPDELVGIHDLVRTYRNATVAHSQSELAVTYARGVLDSESFNVRGVMAATMCVPFPPELVLEFRALIDSMERRLDEVLAPLRASLAKELAGMDRGELAAAAGPEVHEKWAHEFNPKTKRARYPTGHTVYWGQTVDAPRE